MDKTDIKSVLKSSIEESDTHEEVSEFILANFIFMGKTLAEHSEDLAIQIPEAKDLTPLKFRELQLQVAYCIQRASHYLATASTTSNTFSAGASKVKSDFISEQVKAYEKRNARRPGASILNEVAEKEIEELTSIKNATKILKDFWKIKLDALFEIRRCLDAVGISMTSEMKYLGE